MANYPQELAQDAVCQSHTGHKTGLWFLPTRPLRLNTNEWMMNTLPCSYSCNFLKFTFLFISLTGFSSLIDKCQHVSKNVHFPRLCPEFCVEFTVFLSGVLVAKSQCAYWLCFVHSHVTSWKPLMKISYLQVLPKYVIAFPFWLKSYEKTALVMINTIS